MYMLNIELTKKGTEKTPFIRFLSPFPPCFESFRPWFGFTANGAVRRPSHHHQPFFPYARAIKNKFQFDLFTRCAALIRFRHSPASHQPAESTFFGSLSSNIQTTLCSHVTANFCDFRFSVVLISLSRPHMHHSPLSMFAAYFPEPSILRAIFSFSELNLMSVCLPCFCIFFCQNFILFLSIHSRVLGRPHSFASSLDAVGFSHYERYDYYGCGMWAVVAIPHVFAVAHPMCLHLHEE